MRNDKPIIILFIVTLFCISCFYGCGQQQAEIERQKEISRRIVEEAWNQGNFSVLDEQYAPDFVYHQTPFPDIKGLEAYKQYVRDNRTNYPDLRLTLHDVVIEGDRVVTRGSYAGTQKGVSPTLGISTGKPVNFEWCQVSRKVNGKFVEVWSYVDWLGFMRQIGYTMTSPVTEKTFARVTVTKTKLDKIEESTKLYRESVVPAAKEQKGFRGIMLLSDPETGKGLSIAIWDSETDALANEQSGYYKAQVDKFKEFFSGRPVREGYVVSVQE